MYVNEREKSTGTWNPCAAQAHGELPLILCRNIEEEGQKKRKIRSLVSKLQVSPCGNISVDKDTLAYTYYTQKTDTTGTAAYS